MKYDRPAPRTADIALPRKSIVMLVYPDEIRNLAVPELPEGYSFRLYRPGDAVLWAELMVKVKEFSCVEDGVNCFTKCFMEQEEDLKERCGFIIAPDGTVAATSMAWMFEENGTRYGRLHWVAADPTHQNKGLGRAIVTWGVVKTRELEPGRVIYLDTQTWSHKAIGLYMRIGFHPVRDSHPVLKDANEYSAAVEVLRDVMPEETFRMFTGNAVD